MMNVGSFGHSGPESGKPFFLHCFCRPADADTTICQDSRVVKIGSGRSPARTMVWQS